MRNKRLYTWFIVVAAMIGVSRATGFSQDAESARREQETIDVGAQTGTGAHTQHPDAQWYPDASFGLFIHWGISSTRSMNISWPMIPGRPLAAKKIDDAAEQLRIIREGDWNLDGKKPAITPNEYWEMAKSFNPDKYDPDKWLKAAKEAGFTYVVLTAKHHEGFALWPSKFGDFNTKNWMGGKDLLRPYVDACRKYGLKVGFYYSPPDWYFDREYMSFLYGRARQNNPWVPNLGPDLKPREINPDPEARKKHQEAYAAYVKGQIEELLTNYGKIDVLWFDGRPGIPNPTSVITPERIRELQPGIVMNGRLHGNERGDFKTFERTMNIARPEDGWAEFCNTWTTGWSHQEIPFRASGYVLGQLVTSRSLGVNYLLGVGPMGNGEFCEDIYRNMAVVAEWMKANGESIRGTRPLPANESASLPAVAAGSTRYLFALPTFKNGGAYDKDLEPAADMTVNLTGAGRPKSVTLLGDGTPLIYVYGNGQLAAKLPAEKRTKLVDVVRVEIETAK